MIPQNQEHIEAARNDLHNYMKQIQEEYQQSCRRSAWWQRFVSIVFLAFIIITLVPVAATLYLALWRML